MGFFATLEKFTGSSLKFHLVVSLLVRFVLIALSSLLDVYSSVPYTDVDYHVFSDAARYVYNGTSPYNRRTYRYSPLLAYILLPNVYWPNYGKVLFSLVDSLMGLMTYILVKSYFENTRFNLNEFLKELEDSAMKRDVKEIFPTKLHVKCECMYAKYYLLQSDNGKIRACDGTINDTSENFVYMSNYTCDSCIEKKSKISAMFWLYNPVAIVIATRGNCDSIACVLVAVVLYFLRKSHVSIAAVMFALAVHFRIYPILFSLTIYLHMRTNKRFENHLVARTSKNLTLMLVEMLAPNVDQLRFVFTTIFVLVALTSGFYYVYGYEFIHETYVYHLTRNDARHNFSVYFYLVYLTREIKNIGFWQIFLTKFPNVVLQIALAFKFGPQKDYLYLSLLVQAFVMVTYNTVVTSQYFLWYLSLIPLTFWQINFHVKDWMKIGAVWLVAQLAWLLPAYMLEFRGVNTFLIVWLQGIAFFSANVLIVARLIKAFDTCARLGLVGIQKREKVD